MDDEVAGGGVELEDNGDVTVGVTLSMGALLSRQALYVGVGGAGG